MDTLRSSFVYTDVKNLGAKTPVQDLNKGEKQSKKSTGEIFTAAGKMKEEATKMAKEV